MTSKTLVILEISKTSVIELVKKGSVKIETPTKTFQIVVNPKGEK